MMQGKFMLPISERINNRSTSELRGASREAMSTVTFDHAALLSASADRGVQ
jgi:hypothetical protein